VSTGSVGSIEDEGGVHDPDSQPPVEPPPEPKRWHERWSWRILIILVLLVLFAGWRSGTFDHALYNVGLNAKPCARNGFGATFCGQELTEYRERLARGKEEGEAAAQKAKQEGEAASRKIEEASEKAKRESETLEQHASEAQHRSEEALKRSTEEAQRQTEPPATPESGSP
jgi:hypothetical protein